MSNDCGCDNCDCETKDISVPKMHGHQVTLLSGTSSSARQNGASDDARQKTGTYLVLTSALFLAAVAFMSSRN
jgi:hypothetical protein